MDDKIEKIEKVLDKITEEYPNKPWLFMIGVEEKSRLVSNSSVITQLNFVCVLLHDLEVTSVISVEQSLLTVANALGQRQ